MPYLYQLSDWPNFTYDADALKPHLAKVENVRRIISERLAAIGLTSGDGAALDLNVRHLVQDAVGSSAIEGETLAQTSISKAVRQRLAQFNSVTTPPDIKKNSPGIVDVIIDATQNYAEPLTKERLFGWQRRLFPTGLNGQAYVVKTGAWRDGSKGKMQIVTPQADGTELVDYEPPSAERVDKEMSRFLEWFNRENEPNPTLKSGIAHLWFEVIHPFDDGNGRLGRAISDMMLARAENSSTRIYSLSARINKDKDGYYAALQQADSGGTVDITRWLTWHVRCLNRALRDAEAKLNGIIITAGGLKPPEVHKAGTARRHRQRRRRTDKKPLGHGPNG